MKKLILLLTLILMVGSCDSIKDSVTIPVNTTLHADMTIQVPLITGALPGLKAGTVYPFTKSTVLSLSENEDVNLYIQKIKEVSLTSVKITINGLSGTQSILSLDLSVTGITNPIYSVTGITATTNVLTPVITPAIQSQLDLVEAKLMNDRTITLVVSGTTNAAPLTLTADIELGAKFVCYVFN